MTHHTKNIYLILKQKMDFSLSFGETNEINVSDITQQAEEFVLNFDQTNNVENEHFEETECENANRSGFSEINDADLIRCSQQVEWNNYTVDIPTLSDDVDENDLIRCSQQVEWNNYTDDIPTLSDDVDENDLILCSKQVEENEMKPNIEISEPGRFQFITEKDISILQTKRFADTTEGKITWAVQLFCDWRNARNLAISTDSSLGSLIPTVDIEYFTPEELDYTLQRFITDIRKKRDCKPYPGKTLKEIILCIQMHLDKKGVARKLLDNEHFSKLNNTLTNTMIQRAKEGDDEKTKQASELTIEQEESLWQREILGSDTPEKLVRTLFFLVGLHFALRGGKEHRDLRIGEKSQFSIGIDSVGNKFLQYTQSHAKNRQGSSKDVLVPRKCVKAFCNVDPERCVVCLYEKYLRLRPMEPDFFYLYGLKFPTENIWYTKKPLGVHTLQNVVRNICKIGGLYGNFTNHSLRATAATRLYHAGVDEQLIKEVTGHRSTAVRHYKRTNDRQKREISKLLSSNEQISAEEPPEPSKKSKKTTESQPIAAQSTSDITQSINMNSPMKGFNISINFNVTK